MADTSIITEQFVRIDQTPASVGERIGAQVVDWLILIVYTIAASYLVTIVGALAANNVDDKAVGMVFAYIFILAPILFYSLFCEIFNHGQSLGKKLLKIRVVKVDGSVPGLGAYLLRWVLFLVDFPSGIGLLVMLLNKNSQRIGDLAAGTMVIKQKNYHKIQLSLDEYDYLTKGYKPTYSKASGLSLEQVDVIARALQTGYCDRDERIKQLALKVKELLDITSNNITDEKFLSILMRDYQYYALEDF